MTEIAESVLGSIRAMWPWEGLAVVSLILYLVLAVHQNAACWLAAIVGTSIYLVLLFNVGLYMESALQIFYIAMAVYGWYAWRHGFAADSSLPVTSWPVAWNLPPMILIGVLTLGSGWWLANNTDASLPYLDSFTTWASVVTTWMVARKILQNWHYWFVIDSVSVYLYSSRGLWLSAGLYMFYLILIVMGYRNWKRSWVATAHARD